MTRVVASRWRAPLPASLSGAGRSQAGPIPEATRYMVRKKLGPPPAKYRGGTSDSRPHSVSGYPVRIATKYSHVVMIHPATHAGWITRHKSWSVWRPVAWRPNTTDTPLIGRTPWRVGGESLTTNARGNDSPAPRISLTAPPVHQMPNGMVRYIVTGRAFRCVGIVTASLAERARPRDVGSSPLSVPDPAAWCLGTAPHGDLNAYTSRWRSFWFI